MFHEQNPARFICSASTFNFCGFEISVVIFVLVQELKVRSKHNLPSPTSFTVSPHHHPLCKITDKDHNVTDHCVVASPNVFGCFKSFIRFYESTLNRNISVNTYSI